MSGGFFKHIVDNYNSLNMNLFPAALLEGGFPQQGNKVY